MKEIYYRSNGDLCGRGEGTRVGEGGYFFIGCSEKEKIQRMLLSYNNIIDF